MVNVPLILAQSRRGEGDEMRGDFRSAEVRLGFAGSQVNLNITAVSAPSCQ